MPAYAGELTLGQARARYFELAGLDEAGYDDAWVRFRVGPVPFAIPNTPGRRRAVRLHDAHHVLTEYGTDLVGEAEIGAWEIASGCRSVVAAWVLNLLVLWPVMWFRPARVWRAFVRGRRSRNLYAGAWNPALLERRVDALRRELGIPAEPSSATAGDAAAFAATCVGAVVAGAGPAALLAAGVWWLVA